MRTFRSNVELSATQMSTEIKILFFSCLDSCLFFCYKKYCKVKFFVLSSSLSSAAKQDLVARRYVALKKLFFESETGYAINFSLGAIIIVNVWSKYEDIHPTWYNTHDINLELFMSLSVLATVFFINSPFWIKYWFKYFGFSIPSWYTVSSGLKNFFQNKIFSVRSFFGFLVEVTIVYALIVIWSLSNMFADDSENFVEASDWIILFSWFDGICMENLLNPIFILSNPIGYIYCLVLGFSIILEYILVVVSQNTEINAAEELILAFGDLTHVKLDEWVVWLWESPEHLFDINLFYDIFSGPWIIKFAFLFLSTTIVSLFSLSYLGMYGVFVLNLISLTLFWLSSLFFCYVVIFQKKIFMLSLGKWFTINNNFDVKFELLLDQISISFVTLTLSIAVFVYIYCFSYFRYEPNVDRLLLFINLFVISMVLLVSSGNLVVMYLGWELIGLTSFFLINFWSTKILSLKSAFKAFTFNKISDVCILISILLTFMLLNDINTLVINKQIMFYSDIKLNVIGFDVIAVELLAFFLLTAAFIKSAQFGFHIWLPDSMEAPVPASALIHSATLVSAGVYLILRLSPVFELSYLAYYIIPLVGSLTAAFGGVCAAYQSDIKKILAYSTISHCGFLMVSFSTGYIEYTILYLYVHGFFKAAVFLCVGNVIRFSRNYQDFRRMGLFYKYLPVECMVSFICLINLCGLPFTLGFYIKHTVLLGLPPILYSAIYCFITIGALSGIVYSFRLFYNVFFDFKKAKKAIYFDSSQSNLKSKFYSNSSLAATISILGLIFFSYVIIIYLYNLLLNGVELKSELSHLTSSVSDQFNYYLPTESFKKNVFYVNFLVLFTALLVYLVKWRKTYNFPSFYSQFLFLVNFSIFFYVIISIVA